MKSYKLLRVKKKPIYSKLARNLSYIAKEFNLIHSWHRLPFKIIRTYAGYWQRSAGAWSFYLADDEGHEVFGSCNKAKDVLRAYKNKKLEYYEDRDSPTFIVN